jgi:hypothetical protein
MDPNAKRREVRERGTKLLMVVFTMSSTTFKLNNKKAKIEMTHEQNDR